METVYVCARLRAIEERLKGDLDDLASLGRLSQEGPEANQFLIGKAAGLARAIGEIKVLREYLSTQR